MNSESVSLADTSPFESPSFGAILLISMNPTKRGSGSGIGDFLFLIILVLNVLVVNYLLVQMRITESEKHARSHTSKTARPSLICPM